MLPTYLSNGKSTPMSWNLSQPLDTTVLIHRIPLVLHSTTSASRSMISRPSVCNSASISSRSRGGVYW